MPMLPLQFLFFCCGFGFFLLFSPKTAIPLGEQCGWQTVTMCAVKMQQGKKGEVGEELVEVAAGGLVGTRVWSELTQGLGNGLKELRAESGHRAAGRD